MPIHFNDVNLDTEVSGLKSALIVPCIMCPAVTVSIREKQPLLNLFRSIFKSAPFEQYLMALQMRLGDRGIKADIFKSRLYQHWFLCMWSSARRKKLQRQAQRYEAIIVLGCDSATKTVRDAIQSPDCRIIEGMKFGGLTNAKMKISFPAKISFEDVKIVPLRNQETERELTS